MNEDCADDPIAQALQARKKAGGSDRQLSELDAKKQKLNVPKPLKLKTAGQTLISFVVSEHEEKQEDKKPVAAKKQSITQIQKTSKEKPKQGAASKEQVELSEPIDPSDTI